MRRPTLFPPPGTVETLPESVLTEARRLLVKLVIAVLKESAKSPSIEKEHKHDKD
jgi:hypothetical protein